MRLRRSSKSSVWWDSEVMEESGVWIERCDGNETERVVELPRGTQLLRGGCFLTLIVLGGQSFTLGRK